MRIPSVLSWLLIQILQILAQTQSWTWLDDGPETSSILLMGDTNIQLHENPEEAFKFVLHTLLAADIRILNLEGPFAWTSTDAHEQDIPHKEGVHSELDQVAALTAANIDALGVANNMIRDFHSGYRRINSI